MGETRAKVLRLDRQPLLTLIIVVTACGTTAVGTVTGIGSVLAVALGFLVALAALGWGLWRTEPKPQDARANLGAGLLVGVIVAGAVGCAQYAIDERRSDSERRRDDKAEKSSHKLSLRTTVGLQRTLAGFDFKGEDLTEFFFSGKNLQEARFADASLVDAVMSRADLSFADLQHANLHHAELLETDLRFTDLRGADLTGANLTGATLEGADLRGVDVDGAALGAARLAGADLSDVKNLGRADLRGASADANTIWPPGFNHEGVRTQ